MSWWALISRNLRRRPARTVFTAVGVGVGVGLIVALLAITNGVHRTAQDLLHVGRADFGLYQAGVSDFPRSLLPESLASSVARDPGVAAVVVDCVRIEGKIEQPGKCATRGVIRAGIRRYAETEALVGIA